MLGTRQPARRASGGIWQVSRNNPVLPEPLRHRRRAHHRPLGIPQRPAAADQGRRQRHGERPRGHELHRRRLHVRHQRAQSAGVPTSPPPRCRRPAAPTRSARTSTPSRAQRKHELGSRHRSGADWRLRRGHRHHRRQPDGLRRPRRLGPGNYTRFREVENGIFSANRLKAPHARPAGRHARRALGVGAGIGGAADNLLAISGPAPNSDYFQTDTFVGAAAVLRALALGNCVGSLTIVKQEVPAGNAPATPRAQCPPAGGTSLRHPALRM